MSKAKLGWGHINVNVSNLERSIEFYSKLGFEVFLPGIPYLDVDSTEGCSPLPETATQALGLAEGTQGRACIMQLDDGFPKLDLTEYSNLQQQQPLENQDLGLVRICLASHNLLQDYQDLLARGIEFVSPPQSCAKRMADVAVCKDPDGTLIELLQIYLERWPALDNHHK